MKCPKQILNVCHALQRKKEYNYDNSGTNLTAGLSSMDLFILNQAGLELFLTKLIGPYEISVGMLLKSIKPYSIHTDYTKIEDYEQQICGKAVLIPIDHVVSHTIIFNQKATKQKDIYNLPDLDKFVDDEIWNTYLSHCNKQLQRKLTIKKIAPWEYGIPILWDRDEIHCSDNHLTQHKIKNALVLFTKSQPESDNKPVIVSTKFKK